MSQAANNFMTGLADADLSAESKTFSPQASRDATGRFKAIRRVASNVRDIIGGLFVAGTLATAILSFAGALDASKLFHYFDIGGAQAYNASAPTEEYVRALYLSVVNDPAMNEELNAIEENATETVIAQ